MRTDLSTHDRAIETIMGTDDPEIIEDNLLILTRNYENRLENTVPKCAEPARTALLQTLEAGVQIAELKLQNASEADIQAVVQQMEANRELFYAEYHELDD